MTYVVVFKAQLDQDGVDQVLRFLDLTHMAIAAYEDYYQDITLKFHAPNGAVVALPGLSVNNIYSIGDFTKTLKSFYAGRVKGEVELRVSLSKPDCANWLKSRAGIYELAASVEVKA